MSEGGNTESGDVFDVDRIRRLVRLMEEHDLSEVDLRQQESRINLKRGHSMPQFVQAAPAPVPVAAPAPVASSPGGSSPVGSPPAVEPAGDGPGVITITAPMVGTFYSRPNPESENFVKVGDQIQSDTTVCIIEAMKVFNEIPAEVSGKVVAVLVENEQSVEFGKPMFKIDTSG